jgi:hypothetical protein
MHLQRLAGREDAAGEEEDEEEDEGDAPPATSGRNAFSAFALLGERP